MADYQALLAEAAQLPVADRIQLIEAIWDSVPESALPPLSEEWLDEIKRRSAEFDAGKVRPVPWEEVRAAALRRLSRNSD